MNPRTLIAALLFVTAPLITYAHGDMIHVMGTVTALTHKTVTVTTTTTDKKSIEVVLTETTILRKWLEAGNQQGSESGRPCRDSCRQSERHPTGA
jgi:hypothetical protein